MENLALSWEDVIACLENPQNSTRKIPDYSISKLKAYFSGKGVHFFKIRYSPGEVIMPQGVYSDFAAVHLQGDIAVHKAPTRRPRQAAGPEECWNRPGWLMHRLENWVLHRTDRLLDAESDNLPRRLRWERRVAVRLHTLGQKLQAWVTEHNKSANEGGWRSWVANRLLRWMQRRQRERGLANPVPVADQDETSAGKHLGDRFTQMNGQELPVLERLMGVSSALWNLPRSVTLTAKEGPSLDPCECLLIKREVLEELFEHSTKFRESIDRRFLQEILPDLLMENRLFRDTFYEADVSDWSALVERLRNPQSTEGAKLTRLLDGSFRQWLRGLAKNSVPTTARYRILSELNSLLKRADLHQVFPRAVEASAEARLFLSRGVASLTDNEMMRLNHLLLEQVLAPDLASKAPAPPPLSRDDFHTLIAAIDPASVANGIRLIRFAKGETVYQEGTPSDALYLIIRGTLRITKTTPGGGQMLLNQFERHGFMGISCLEENRVHSASAVAYTDATVVRLDARAVRQLAQAFPAVAKKLRDERQRLVQRDAQLQGAERLPPVDPPEEIATKLLVATNLLRVNMDLCTRCDQCVEACAEAHDGISRFHRANPKLSFGRWEIAGACVHCSDAPCQNVCPVGAITFLDNGAVQVHRNRCIGCTKCVPACPFEVIEMQPPPSLLDMAEKNIKDKKSQINLVATKCDLCLSDRDPPCVVSCPYGAMERGTPRDLFPNIKNWASGLSSR